jgi:hypothetical protein
MIGIKKHNGCHSVAMKIFFKWKIFLSPEEYNGLWKRLKKGILIQNIPAKAVLTHSMAKFVII